MQRDAAKDGAVVVEAFARMRVAEQAEDALAAEQIVGQLADRHRGRFDLLEEQKKPSYMCI